MYIIQYNAHVSLYNVHVSLYNNSYVHLHCFVLLLYPIFPWSQYQIPPRAFRMLSNLLGIKAMHVGESNDVIGRNAY